MPLMMISPGLFQIQKSQDPVTLQEVLTISQVLQSKFVLYVRSEEKQVLELFERSVNSHQEFIRYDLPFCFQIDITSAVKTRRQLQQAHEALAEEKVRGQQCRHEAGS